LQKYKLAAASPSGREMVDSDQQVACVRRQRS